MAFRGHELELIGEVVEGDHTSLEATIPKLINWWSLAHLGDVKLLHFIQLPGIHRDSNKLPALQPN